MVNKKYFVLLSILVQSFLMHAQKPADKNPGLSIAFNPSALSSQSKAGSAGANAAVAQPSIAEAGIAVSNAINGFTNALTQTPKGVTMPEAVHTLGSAFEAMTKGDPKESGMRHFAGALSELSRAIKATTEGRPEDSSMRHLAYAMQNIGFRKGMLQETLKALDQHALKLLGLCGGTASACSIPVYGLGCSNCCCLAVSLAALRPHQACELVAACAPCQLPKDIAKLVLNQPLTTQDAPKPEMPSLMRDVNSPAVAPITVVAASVQSPIPVSAVDSKHNGTPSADTKKDN
jgi:hypothetical protein